MTEDTMNLTEAFEEVMNATDSAIASISNGEGQPIVNSYDAIMVVAQALHDGELTADQNDRYLDAQKRLIEVLRDEFNDEDDDDDWYARDDDWDDDVEDEEYVEDEY